MSRLLFSLSRFQVLNILPSPATSITVQEQNYSKDTISLSYVLPHPPWSTYTRPSTLLRSPGEVGGSQAELGG